MYMFTLIVLSNRFSLQRTNTNIFPVHLSEEPSIPSFTTTLTLSLPCVSTSSRHQCVLQGTMSVDQGSTVIIYISSFPSVYCYTFSLVYQY